MRKETFKRLLNQSRDMGRDVGFNETGIPGLYVVRRETTGEKRSFLDVYVALILQGSKFTIMDGKDIPYGAGDCVINCIERPSLTFVKEASHEKPFLSFVLPIDRELLQKLALKLNRVSLSKEESSGKSNPVFWVQQAQEEIAQCFLRLLDLKNSPQKIALLAPVIKEELYARMLLSPLGQWMLSVYSLGSRSNQISTAVDMIKAGYQNDIVVEQLASSVNMSVASFHRHFKALTSVSPLQYQKLMRLYEGRRMILSQKFKVSQVAMYVGYGSSAQFSNDYKRLFGCSPKQEQLGAPLKSKFSDSLRNGTLMLSA